MRVKRLLSLHHSTWEEGGRGKKRREEHRLGHEAGMEKQDEEDLFLMLYCNHILFFFTQSVSFADFFFLNLFYFLRKENELSF